ncbi:MAG: DUF3570 domain-containing protein [Gammaproteobacteria bacterium]|nr:DUF3570 domain-containing protein [Gammaproteobacteria bacterium]
MSNNKRSITATLAAATCSLLGSNMPEAVQAQEDPGWDFNTAFLYYGEDNNRVQDLSLDMLARRTYLDDRFLTLGLTLDSLTGASPNGALIQDVAQTFTRPSGNSTYTTAAGEQPLDDTFKDTRLAASANWQQPLGRLYQINVGASGSKEFDYVHLGLNTKISRDFNRRNTTLSAGFAVARDEWDPIGGIPAGLSATGNVGDLSNRSGPDTKNIFDVVFGVTQVMSKYLLVQVNYSYSDSSGYLSDPFKLVGVVDGITGDAVPVPQTPGVEGPSHLYLHEARPDSRTKHSLYTQAKYYMGGKVLDVSYRYMTDDWEIDSHTLDMRYRWPFGNDHYLEPHLRYYTQSEAAFYDLSLVDGAALPDFASADYRLGNFDAITAGLKYGWKTGGGNDMSVRFEWYQQSGTVASNQLIGNQVGRDNYPDLNAVIAQFSYRFGY